jgi:hypothetical protein
MGEWVIGFWNVFGNGDNWRRVVSLKTLTNTIREALPGVGPRTEIISPPAA